MKYRREIDGLRAVAVIPVVFFHSGIGPFHGGYLGVDVFFVISGYLITRILLSDLASGAFSIVDFYERRARRILPALFLVVTVSLPFAVWMTPADVKDFAQSIIATVLFGSNFLFWQESGYFDTAAEFKPLLHTWSLSVEEQFYLMFPALLLILFRSGIHVIYIALVAAFLASLALAQWAVVNKPSANFYLLPTRAWELAAGALLAARTFRAADRSDRSQWIDQVLSMFGLCMVLGSVLFFAPTTPTPSILTLLPVAGTVLIIACATPATVAGRILGNSLLVGIGLISYSLYLWHQPLFVFARHRFAFEPPPWAMGVLIIIALALAYLSWRYVESVFRRRTAVSQRQIFVFAISGSLILCCVGLLGIIVNGDLFRGALSAELTALDHRTRVNYGLHEQCDNWSSNSPKCITHESPEVLLWGDSHAMHLAQGLLASNPTIRMVQKTASFCGPILGIAPLDSQHPKAWAEQCIAHNDQILKYLRSTSSLRYVVMGSIFSQYVDSHARVHTPGMLVMDTAEGEHRTLVLHAFRDTIKQIKRLGIEPVVFAPIPQTGGDIGRCLVKTIAFAWDSRACDFDQAETRKFLHNEQQLVNELADIVRIVDLDTGICPDGNCRASIDGTLIYRDKSHLSHEGSAFIGRRLDFYGQLTQSERDRK